ncbi:hypothetical protein BT93_K1141 [Corymbia citriodora subsp. variegata]|nr:hypothetical protein BT93_K1141 [Corymbia citriodora subsp. variegata]
MNDRTSRFNCFKPQSSHSKALKIAVGFSGVQSVAFVGDDRDWMEVIGDRVDAVKLATLLRKRVGFAEIVSMSEVNPKDEEDSDPIETIVAQPVMWSYNGRSPHLEIVYVPHFNEPWGWPL